MISLPSKLQKNPTAKEISDSIGIPEKTVARWLRGENTEHMEKYVEMIEYLKNKGIELKKGEN